MGKYEFLYIQYDFKFKIFQDAENGFRVALDNTQDKLEKTCTNRELKT